MHAKYVLGIDPGSAKLGMSCVKWNGVDCNDEKNYSIEWMCLIHLTDSFDGKEIEGTNPTIDVTTEIVKYKEMHAQIERLYAFLSGNENFNAILKIPDVRVCIEQQEGARDINVLFALMRINFLMGVVCCYLKRKNVPFTFVPKTYKCGWSLMGTLAKERLKRRSQPSLSSTLGRNGKIIEKKVRTDITPTRKKTLLRQYRKEAVCAFVRRVVRVGCSSDAIKRSSLQHKDVDFNHMADSASQAIRYVKEMKLSGCYDNNARNVTGNVRNTLKKVKDGTSIEMKKYLSTAF